MNDGRNRHGSGGRDDRRDGGGRPSRGGDDRRDAPRSNRGGAPGAGRGARGKGEWLDERPKRGARDDGRPGRPTSGGSARGARGAGEWLDERPKRGPRDDRNERPRRDDRGAGSRRDDWSDRPRRDDRAGSARRDDRAGSARRDDRAGAPRRGEWSDRPRRDDRAGAPRRDDRAERPRRDEWSDRPRRDDRAGAPRRDDRAGAARRDDRTERPRRDDWSDRPRRDDRGGAPRREDWSDRPRRDDRGGAPRRDDRTERPRRDDRTDRRDRPERGEGGGDRRSFDAGRGRKFGSAADRRIDAQRSRGPRRDERRDDATDVDRREARAESDAVRLARAARPAGGYSLDDFDDIPMPGTTSPAQQARREQDVDGSMRLQKALANAGVASRRVCEQYIQAGRVSVNGSVVTELGSRVHPQQDRIEVDGTPVQLDTEMMYVVLNKPTGVVSTMRDEAGRPDLRQFTRAYTERLFNVGRLDGATSGLLLLTNDGDLANVLAHPSYGVEKTYVAKVRGRVTPQALQRLLTGFDLEDGFIKADRAIIVGGQPKGSATLIELTIHSGRNRIVRRMFDHIEHPVQELVRRSFGPLHLGTLRAGDTRELSTLELGRLLTLARRAERRREVSADANAAVDRDDLPSE